MEEKFEYILTKDASGNLLDGEKSYGLNLPPNITANEFWSVIVYDTCAKLIIKNSQAWPSVFSTSKSLVLNQDGSADLLFWPEEPKKKKSNWIQTVPGKGWVMILRIYRVLEFRPDESWKPSLQCS